MKRLTLLLLFVVRLAHAYDANTNQQSDIWEIAYGVSGLGPTADADGDGFSNAIESLAGTNPLDGADFPKSDLTPGIPGQVLLSWPSQAGKRYQLFGSQDLNPVNFMLLGTFTGDGASMLETLSTASQSRWFFKLVTDDLDSDSDGLSDWEEHQIGFNPLLNHSDRNDIADLTRVQSTLNAASIITVGLLDGDMREDWPDKGVIAIRRSGGLKPVTINVTFTGTATRNADYTASIPATQVTMPFGARETWIELTPVNDASAEGLENIVVTVTSGSGYTLGSVTSTTATLGDASLLPSAKEAARFLIQAAFGPDQDGNDGDAVPENVEEVMAMGIDAWIEDQFTRPKGYIQPYTNWALQYGNDLQLYGNYKQHSWWRRAMGSPKLRPDSPTDQLPDLLRQRVAFALSEILVTSDRP